MKINSYKKEKRKGRKGGVDSLKKEGKK